jgi:transposase
MPDTHQYLSYLDLKKQRFLCRNCNTTTTAKTDLVKTRARIAKNVHQLVALGATHNISLKDIGKRHGNYTSTVQRFLTQDNRHLLGYQCRQLPEHLLFDELKIVGTYSFIMMDSRKKQLLEILPSRLTNDLKMGEVNERGLFSEPF